MNSTAGNSLSSKLCIAQSINCNSLFKAIMTEAILIVSIRNLFVSLNGQLDYSTNNLQLVGILNHLK